MAAGDDPATLITEGATWNPGAWTPARCRLWEMVGPTVRQGLSAWVMAEPAWCLENDEDRYPSQLPDWFWERRRKKEQAPGADAGQDERTGT